MRDVSHITFVAASNNRDVLDKNLLASPSLGGEHGHQIIIQEGYDSAAKAYNDAIDRSENDLMVFLHQDVILPMTWPSDLAKALDCLDIADPSWGVLGCYGEIPGHYGRGYVYSSGRNILGRSFPHPLEVQTLDEIVLIFRKSSGLRFDQGLPHFHMYGTDICLIASEMGKKNYAISAFCIHNTVQTLVLPKEFYDCYWYIRRKWAHCLPIQTTCIKVTGSNFPMYRRRIGELKLSFHQNIIGGTRAENVRELIKEVEAMLSGSR